MQNHLQNQDTTQRDRILVWRNEKFLNELLDKQFVDQIVKPPYLQINW